MLWSGNDQGLERCSELSSTSLADWGRRLSEAGLESSSSHGSRTQVASVQGDRVGLVLGRLLLDGRLGGGGGDTDGWSSSVLLVI